MLFFGRSTRMKLIQTKHRWLAPLAAVALSLAALSAVGCSGESDPVAPPPVPLSSEAGISSIALSKGTLLPGFQAGINRYNVDLGHLDVQSTTLTVTLKDSKAKLTVNGKGGQSGAAVPLALSDGANQIWIGTVAEDGVTTGSTSITINKAKTNTRVWVLDSFGGAPVQDVVLTLTDADGTVLEGNVALPAGENGSPVFALDPSKKYNIYAKGKDSSQACFANFHPVNMLDENGMADVALYCRPSQAKNYPAEAPIITNISFAPSNAANAAWKTMPNDSEYIGSAANVVGVKVTAISRCAITETYVSNAFPISVNWDAVAWIGTAINSSGAPQFSGAQMENSTPIKHNNVDYFQSTWRFTLPVQSAIFNKKHWLDVAVYDIAENRTEQRVYLTLVDSMSNATDDPNLSAVAPLLTGAQTQTYGVTQVNASGKGPGGDTADGLDPIDDYGVTGVVVLSFKTVAATPFPAVRGFEVWRSIGDDKNFKKIDTMNYATTSTGTDGAFSYNDRTQGFGLTSGTLYYKVRFFNGNPANNGYSLFSNVMTTKFLPPFTAQLSAPAHLGVSDKLWPTFKFDITNPALVVKDVTDRLRFTLYVKDIYYNVPVIKVHFRADMNVLDEKGQPKFYVLNKAGDILFEAAYDTGEVDEDDEPIMRPFVWLEGNKVVIDTDNEVFEEASYRSSLLTEQFFDWFMLPGATYEWNIFGADGGVVGSSAGGGGLDNTATNAAYLYKAYTVPSGSPAGSSSTAFTFGSTSRYSLGAPNGFFTLTIDPDAE